MSMLDLGPFFFGAQTLDQRILYESAPGSLGGGPESRWIDCFR